MTPSASVRRRLPATRIGTVIVELIGTDLPGRTCGPDMDGQWYDAVRVGFARGTDGEGARRRAAAGWLAGPDGRPRLPTVRDGAAARDHLDGGVGRTATDL